MNETRPATEVPSAISWQEIQAFEAAQDLQMASWEKSLIRALDKVALTVWSKKSNDREPESMVDVTDSAGLGSMLRSMAARRKER